MKLYKVEIQILQVILNLYLSYSLVHYQVPAQTFPSASARASVKDV